MAKKTPTTTAAKATEKTKETVAKTKKIDAPSAEEIKEDVKKDAKTEAKTAPAKAAKAAPAGKKSATIKKFQRSANDTGSTEVQVAVISEKINQLSSHLSTHKKDKDSRMGLLKMISQRRSLLGYLEKKQPDTYKKLIASLGLRK